jgi:glycogen synthase
VAEPLLRVALLARSVSPLHGVGGLERHVHDLVHHLARRRVAVTLITRPALDDARARSPELAFDVPPERVRLVTVPYVTFPGAGRRGTTIIDRSTAYPLFGWRAGRAAVRLARRGEVDIVHALGASGLGYAMARLRHEPTVPFVFNPQGLEEFGATHPGFARLKRFAYAPLQAAVRTCARAADVVIATDRALEAPVRVHLGTPAARVRLVPNAVDVAAIDAARATADSGGLRSALGLAADERLLLSVGRQEANKGFHVLARALGRLDALGTGIRWRWALVGDGPHRGAILQAASEAQVASRMIVPGRVREADLASWYGAADLFVHPTLYEGSSLVTLEAMAHGRAVVATRAGGLPDKVVPGETGWLVAPGDADELARALADALGDTERLARFGRAGRALVERTLAWPAAVGALMTIYTDLLHADGARSDLAKDPRPRDRT